MKDMTSFNVKLESMDNARMFSNSLYSYIVGTSTSQAIDELFIYTGELPVIIDWNAHTNEFVAYYRKI